ncbi:glycosyltransferase [Asticcacaulis sp. 201]|uniref:glycosyltransferase n=1 Tax=Asticcacaulis sp. 201 TaxID=3028787 RepID=UPI00291643BD|nr:glycosyltransferase [Asticcacaulis sp. 201]MDV6331829.1 glycosyltransferase [Asticcacaulis sp. 201]
MRILNIMLAEVRGGVETMSLRYHQAMKAAGFTVLSLGHKDGVLGQNLPAAEFRAAHALVNHDPFVALALRGIAKTFKPDLILTHGNRATGIALLPFIGTANKTVQVVHNFRHKGQGSRLLAAICVSSSVHDSLKAAHPELPLYDVANFGPLDARDVKPAPSHTPILGTLGRLHAQKGIDVMIRALALLQKENIILPLRIAGDGPLSAQLHALAHEQGVERQTDFRGWVSPAADYLHGLDLFILPSRIEPFGLVVAESMAAGVPVVATDIDGPKEILKDGALGYLCPPDDPHALAEAIKRAIGDWKTTLAKARAAQDHALSHYSLEAGQARLIDALKQIAQNRP